ncbi:MAG: hypothetical protein JWM68_696 [Verrucomicrobiales bacterium]|nr:hypothetical protein [Verrucomicrobiales bacterium]
MITLEANYSKKIGLPQYSSHQFSLTIRTELTDLKQVEAATSHLYELLQGCVDHEMQKIGYLPLQIESSGNGNRQSHPSPNGNGHNGNGNGHPAKGHNGNHADEKWECSEKQKGLILKVVDEHKLDKAEVEKLSQERFGKSVRLLNKLDASSLIDELLRMAGQPVNRVARFQKARPR